MKALAVSCTCGRQRNSSCFSSHSPSDRKSFAYMNMTQEWVTFTAAVTSPPCGRDHGPAPSLNGCRRARVRQHGTARPDSNDPPMSDPRHWGHHPWPALRRPPCPGIAALPVGLQTPAHTASPTAKRTSRPRPHRGTAARQRRQHHCRRPPLHGLGTRWPAADEAPGTRLRETKGA